MLDAAELVVQRDGSAGLSFDAVAREAGISKGGIQSAFGTKLGLLDAMLERWTQGHEDAICAHMDAGDQAGARVRGHVRATVKIPEAERARIAALLSALVQSRTQHAATRDWYASVIGDGSLGPDLDRATRLAFMAAEGLFFLKYFDLIEMPDDVWEDIGQDILALLARNAMP